MRAKAVLGHGTILAALLAVSGCGSLGSIGSGPSLGSAPGTAAPATRQATRTRGAEQVAVNRYLWQASLDVLSFLPIESVDPFTGVIVMGYGTPPGSSRAYRATVYVSDPALDARALNVAIATRSGPVAQETTRAVEDAILARAREIRIRDGRL
ncbi:DUF3576 domain-containing protein [Histidinibacterium aquaticum]|uniref:DUF3576 domain-containing protein n=1 Tax=Histidinibacterium aquaticum TaxID=2613962 RepID=A0A5J5GCT3_9RHOB|nr:DUF3576 domain-containing protein [Histidinibacterium aquaticum]KAA9005989.1 DUF3576 domain-containing protein [Histidinibacterium aquaticum]